MYDIGGVWQWCVTHGTVSSQQHPKILQNELVRLIPCVALARQQDNIRLLHSRGDDVLPQRGTGVDGICAVTDGRHVVGWNGVRCGFELAGRVLHDVRWSVVHGEGHCWWSLAPSFTHRDVCFDVSTHQAVYFSRASESLDKCNSFKRTISHSILSCWISCATFTLAIRKEWWVALIDNDGMSGVTRRRACVFDVHWLKQYWHVVIKMKTICFSWQRITFWNHFVRVYSCFYMSQTQRVSPQSRKKWSWRETWATHVHITGTVISSLHDVA